MEADDSLSTTTQLTALNDNTIHLSFFPTTTTTTPTTTAATTAANPRTKEESFINGDYSFPWLYVSPLILIFGCIGNILIICVMRRKKMRNSTTAVYLVGLGIFDTLALVSRVLPEVFMHLRIGTFGELNNDVAIWLIVLFTIDRFIAVCLPLFKRKICLPKRAFCMIVIVALLLLGKNIHIFWTRGPMYESKNFTLPINSTEHLLMTDVLKSHLHAAQTTSSSIETTGNVSNHSPREIVLNETVVTVSVLKTNCGRLGYFESKIRPRIALITISIIPFCIICFCNVAIIYSLVKMSRKMKVHKRQSNVSVFSKIADMSIRIAKVKEENVMQCPTDSDNERISLDAKQLVKDASRSSHLNESTSTASSQTNHLAAPPSKNSSGMTQTTLMCLSTSIAFLICVYPSIILSNMKHLMDTPSSRTPYRQARAFFFQMSVLNHAINFFLYCLTGQRFRRELVKMLNEWLDLITCKKCKARRKQNLMSSMRSSRSTSITFTNKLTKIVELQDEESGMNYSSSLPNGDPLNKGNL
ncbi:hypothetical protein HELRODRAFT_188682 [Helobdella robusta]|uniref:G-protein coupled receptors family 1 profile domain-containing protein n=1 Tax=Helobdella robusta TaxID=6412 RepID=T1FQ90_HELRO|nr:hypothetical protein HELRODRAFT_188682 [Helobdella robusta]ESO02382.1 hypothetical protein HELRODRAFT_188682 [Helobdella robusta]